MIASIRGKKTHVYRVIILKQMADHSRSVVDGCRSVVDGVRSFLVEVDDKMTWTAFYHPLYCLKHHGTLGFFLSFIELSYYRKVWYIKSTRDCLKANNAEYFNDDCWIINITFSSVIYRRLDFGINISDVHDERSSVKVVEASVPTRKSKISDVLCSEEDSNSAFPTRESRENPWGGGYFLIRG